MGTQRRPPRRKSSSQSDQPVRSTSLCWRVLGLILHSEDTAFKQQRLKAWQPILTPKAVLPTLFLIGIIFAPIGGLIVWGSGKVTTITLDYTQCDVSAPTDGSYQAMSSGNYDCEMPCPRVLHRRRADLELPHTDDLATSSSVSASSIAAPTWTFSNQTSRPIGKQAVCEIQFEVPYNLGQRSPGSRTWA